MAAIIGLILSVTPFTNWPAWVTLALLLLSIAVIVFRLVYRTSQVTFTNDHLLINNRVNPFVPTTQQILYANVTRVQISYDRYETAFKVEVFETAGPGITFYIGAYLSAGKYKRINNMLRNIYAVPQLVNNLLVQKGLMKEKEAQT